MEWKTEKRELLGELGLVLVGSLSFSILLVLVLHLGGEWEIEKLVDAKSSIGFRNQAMLIQCNDEAWFVGFRKGKLDAALNFTFDHTLLLFTLTIICCFVWYFSKKLIPFKSWI